MLIAVHVLFAAHLAHWFWKGRTISPVEPSESMRTFELGEVNAGVIFFAVAILSTFVFGRFFCGWGCHIVALQDLCGWIMKKCGVRPKPFRSRLLVYIPLILAVYMFVWPTVKRVAVGPALRGVWPSVDRDLRITPFPEQGFTNHLMTEGFWDTFASPIVAVPFLLICGFAAVYFLGAKGFCTYGCPYGGVFGPVDMAAVGKIVVDHDKCHGCAHCTAVCTSNVRVHEEIREFGMVVNPGCMKCMDCVSVCPNDALSFRFARPTVRRGAARHVAPKPILDTSLGEDVGLAAVFALIFFATRGAYGVIPMLMAVGIAGCGTFLAWKGWRMARDANVRLSIWQLKRANRLSGAGMIFAAVLAAAAALTAHTGIVNYFRWRGDNIYFRLDVPKQRALLPGQPPFDDETVRQARAGIAHYRRASWWRDGGIGLAGTPASDLREALLHLVAGDARAADAILERVIRRFGPEDELVADAGRVKLLAGDQEGAASLFERTLAARPEFWAVREQWALLMLLRGEAGRALAEAERALAQLPPERFTRVAHARTRYTSALLLNALGRPDDAIANLRAATEVRPEDPVLHDHLAAALYQIKGDVNGAIDAMSTAVKLNPADVERRLRLAHLLIEAGRREEASAHLDDLKRRRPNDEFVRNAVAALERAVGE